MSNNKKSSLDDDLNVDKIFKSVRSYGRYQTFFFVTCQLMSISNAMAMIAGFFRLGKLVPDYFCLDEGNSWNLSAAEVKRDSPVACQMISNCSHIKTQNHWYSMYEEFNWVCGGDHYRAIVQSLMPLGVFCGYMISGHLSDHLGRKWIMVVGEAYSIVGGIACALSPSFTVYLVIAFIGSFITPIGAAASFSLIVESVNPKYRLLQGFSFQYSLGLMLAGVTASFIGHWRIHLLVSNLAGLPALVMMFFLEESPRFYLQHRQFEKAATALTRIARFNGFPERKFTAQQMSLIHALERRLAVNEARKYTLFDLFANWRMASYALAQILTGITMNIVNDVLFFNIQELAGSPFLNTFLMGALRLWTPFAAFALENGTRTIGRWKLLVLSQGTVCFLFSFMLVVDQTELSTSWQSAGTLAVILGYTLESGLVWIAYKLYTTELFPTCVRSIALSTFSCTSLIGSMATPQLTYLSRYWHPAPYSGAAVAAGLSTLLTMLLLPETQFVALPDTMHEATNRDILYKEEDDADDVVLPSPETVVKSRLLMKATA